MKVVGLRAMGDHLLSSAHRTRLRRSSGQPCPRTDLLRTLQKGRIYCLAYQLCPAGRGSFRYSEMASPHIACLSCIRNYVLPNAAVLIRPKECAPPDADAHRLSAPAACSTPMLCS